MIKKNKNSKKELKEKLFKMEGDINVHKNEMSYVAIYRHLYLTLDAINFVEKSILAAFEELDKLEIKKNDDSLDMF